MISRVFLDPQLLSKLQQIGELQVEGAPGIPLVLMTVDTRNRLQKVEYDDSDWTEEELRSVTATWLDDPEGWGAPGMEIYDELEMDGKQDS